LGVFLRANSINAIVGIDPGVTTAVAILNLSGEVVKLKSSRGFSLNKILEFVSLECTPLMIASDVRPASKLLEKVATAFSVRVHTPKLSLSRRNKSLLVSPFDLGKRESHKRDALAAAVNAYESMLPMLKKIETRLSRLGLSNRITMGDVAGKIITGECSNIDTAVKALTCEEEKEGVKIHKRRRLSSPHSLLLVKEREIRSSSELLSRAHEKIKALENEIDFLGRKVHARRDEVKTEISTMQNREIAALKSRLEACKLETQKFEHELGQHRKIFSLIASGWLPGLFLDECEKSGMRAMDKKYGLPGKWLCILSDKKTSGVPLTKRAAGVFCKGRLLEIVKREGVTALDLDNFDYKSAGDFGAVRIAKERASRIKTNQFVSWLERYKARQFR